MDPQSAVKDNNFSPGKELHLSGMITPVWEGFFIQEVNLQSGLISIGQKLEFQPGQGCICQESKLRYEERFIIPGPEP